MIKITFLYYKKIYLIFNYKLVYKPINLKKSTIKKIKNFQFKEQFKKKKKITFYSF